MSSNAGRRRIAVRNSPIHGRGVYALCEIPAGQRVIEYRGQVIAWSAAVDRYSARTDEADASLTYFFDRGDGTVIDGASNGNSARFINHGCRPNCEAVDVDGRIYIDTLDVIEAGTELLIDYALLLDDPADPDHRALYACACNAPTCRSTMLAR